MPFAATRLGEVAYRVQGDGIPVVMLHANLHDGHDFDAIASTLARRFKVVTVDWPWHGESKGLQSVAGNLTAAALADTLEDFMAAAALPPAFFIGNSVGGYAAARLAIEQPQHVRGLVLVNSGGFADWTFVTRLFCRILGIPFVTRLVLPSLVPRYMSPETESDREISKVVAERARTEKGAAVAAALWRSFPEAAGDLRDKAKEIKVPTLLVWGSKDPVCPVEVGETTQRYIPGSKLEVLDSGHVVFSSKPEEFLRLVEPFFDSIAQAGS